MCFDEISMEIMMIKVWFVIIMSCVTLRESHFNFKVIHLFVFQRHMSKPKLGCLWYAVYHRRPIFALIEGIQNTKQCWFQTLC
jgi:hypothetical protein